MDISVGGLNQARTAVCQRYKNMQSPSSHPLLPSSVVGLLARAYGSRIKGAVACLLPRPKSVSQRRRPGDEWLQGSYSLDVGEGLLACLSLSGCVSSKNVCCSSSSSSETVF